MPSTAKTPTEKEAESSKPARVSRKPTKPIRISTKKREKRRDKRRDKTRKTKAPKAQILLARNRKRKKSWSEPRSPSLTGSSIDNSPIEKKPPPTLNELPDAPDEYIPSFDPTPVLSKSTLGRAATDMAQTEDNKEGRRVVLKKAPLKKAFSCVKKEEEAPVPTVPEPKSKRRKLSITKDSLASKEAAKEAKKMRKVKRAALKKESNPLVSLSFKSSNGIIKRVVYPGETTLAHIFESHGKDPKKYQFVFEGRIVSPKIKAKELKASLEDGDGTVEIVWDKLVSVCLHVAQECHLSIL